MLTDGSYEGSFLRHLSPSMRQCVIAALSVNAMTAKAAIMHWRIDIHSGDDGRSLLRMIRPSLQPHPYTQRSVVQELLDILRQSVGSIAGFRAI